MKYPAHYTQTMDPAAYALMPAMCTYEGDESDLAHLKGKLIPTADVEKLVYVGERDNIFVEDENSKWAPWRGVEVLGFPDVKPFYEKLPEPGPRAMSRADLASVGMTEEDLKEAALRLLGEKWEPDTPGSSDKRRDIYDRVSAAAMGD